MDEQQLLARAQAWIEDDPDAETRAELQALVESRDIAELRERLSVSLDFGTAGLRGVVGAGSNRMNQAVVLRAARGLSDYLLSEEDGKGPVVVGFDARLTSRSYAELTLRVLLGAGLEVAYLAEPAPTPTIAYVARELGARAAVIITASHNPPEYNGYKVYASNAVQIVPPLDAKIRARMEQVLSVRSVPLAEFSFESPPPLAEVPEALLEQYYSDLLKLRPACGMVKDLKIVYTPLHGVGWHFVKKAFAAAGYESVEVVPEQGAPDGRFPTVRFPNPEEPGAMDLAFAQARQKRADLVLANDPDADRLAVAVPTSDGWLQLTGNQVGLLLADFLLGFAPRSPQPLVIQSLVSSPMLESIAAAHGARYEVTLTGFKWIWTAALELEQEGAFKYCFGYEEALGYCAGPIVRDKDGISSAVLFADLVSHLRLQGRAVLEQLAELYRRHGLWVSHQHSLGLPGTEGQARIQRAMAKLSQEPPQALAGRAVLGLRDYQKGEEGRPRWLHNTSLLELKLEGGRVLVRPSGTEPKLKIYVDLRVEAGASAPSALSSLEASAVAEARRIAEDAARLIEQA